MTSQSRDTFVPLGVPPDLIHTGIPYVPPPVIDTSIHPIIPQQPPPTYYIPTTTTGLPLQSIYSDAIHQAQAAVYNADNSVHQYINNTYNNIYNTTTEARGDSSGQIANLANSLISAINSMTGTIANSINAAISRTAETVDTSNHQAFSTINDSIHAIQSAISHADDGVSRQIAVDLTPIRQGIDDITSGIRGEIADQYNRQAALVKNFMDYQARTIQQNLDNQRTTLDTVSDAIHDSIQRVASEIEGLLPQRGEQREQPTGFIEIATIIIMKVLMKIAGVPIDVDNQTIADVLKDKSKYIAQTLEGAPSDFAAKFKKLAGDGYPDIDAFIDDFRATGLSSQAINLVLIILLGLGSAAKIAEIIGGPYFQKLAQLSLSKVPTSIPGVPDLLRFNHWFDNYAPEMIANLKKLGFSEGDIANLEASSYTKLPPFEYLHNTFMFNKNVEQARLNIKQQGYSDDDIDIMLENYQGGFPPIQDLIRFMVRETFSPDAEKLGLFEDFPEKIMDFWAAQPIGDIWAKHYWGAHWQNVSPQQAFEMFHRGIINHQQLIDYLRIADYSPYWREKLIQIAYNPVTRVDIRRLYNMGIWNKEQVNKAYLAGGYSPENANALTEFTLHSQDESDLTTHKHIRKIAQDLVKRAFERELINKDEAYNRLVQTGMNNAEAQITAESWQFDRDTERDFKKGTAEKEKIASNIRLDYEKKVISRQFAKDTLQTLGFSLADAEHELVYSDIRSELKLREAKIDNIRVLYVKNRLSAAEALSRLATIGISGQDTNYLFSAWNAEKEKKDRQLSESDVNKLFKAGYITQADYIDYMATLGFDDREIMWLGMLNSPVVSEG
jgi:hypothetical protein